MPLFYSGSATINKRGVSSYSSKLHDKNGQSMPSPRLRWTGTVPFLDSSPPATILTMTPMPPTPTPPAISGCTSSRSGNTTVVAAMVGPHHFCYSGAVYPDFRRAGDCARAVKAPRQPRPLPCQMPTLPNGHIENVAHLKQQYGLNKTANEAIIVIEAYRTLRDRGPYPADQVIRDIQGKFAFILFDCALKVAFVASDADGSVPLFWGSDSEGHLVLSNDGDVAKKGCGKSFAPFPKGCFFTSSGGLRSYEHPVSELKAVPRVDSSGEVCGLTFKVDQESRVVKTGMPRVGSDANWAQQF